MVIASDDARWGVMDRLYARLHRLPPGSPAAETMEHALSLATNINRQVTDAPLFLRSVLRNARFSVQRSLDRRNEALQELGRTGWATGGSLRYTDPENACMAGDLKERIYREVAPLGSLAMRCLSGMLSGEPATETARQCGVSPRTYYRMRQKIQDAVRHLMAS